MPYEVGSTRPGSVRSPSPDSGFGLVGWLTPRLGPSAVLALVGALVGFGGPLLLVATGAIAAMRRDVSTLGA